MTTEPATTPGPDEQQRATAWRSPAARAAAGKEGRKRRPRSSLAGWQPASDRPEPVDILEEQARSRVPELVPIRYGRMAASPFAFYRGAAAVMAWDLGHLPHSGLEVQLCGDAHLANFGGFAAPDRRMVFDINDFDETLPGPFEWDVQRLAASFEIAGRSLQLPAPKRAELVRTMATTYRTTVRELATMTDLDVWYQRLDSDGIVRLAGKEAGKELLARFERTIRRAERKDRYKALAKLTTRVDGQLRFVSDPPLLVPVEEIFTDLPGHEIERVLRQMLLSYQDTLSYQDRHLVEGYTYLHTARKVVGVGSVGTRAWVILLVGRDDADPLFLQVKEAQASVLEPYAGASEVDNHGERVVKGQSLMQAAGDVFLGWDRVVGADDVVRDFYVRQLWDWKASADLATMSEQQLRVYAKICGWSLARAHARTGDRIALASYLGGSDTFDQAMVMFATSYAHRNERDHAALCAAIRDDRLQAQTGI